MAEHKQERARRRARNRIASVNQLDAATPGGTLHDSASHSREDRAGLSRQPTRFAPGVVLFIVVLLVVLTGLWLVL